MCVCVFECFRQKKFVAITVVYCVSADRDLLNSAFHISIEEYDEKNKLNHT